MNHLKELNPPNNPTRGCVPIVRTVPHWFMECVITEVDLDFERCGVVLGLYARRLSLSAAWWIQHSRQSPGPGLGSAPDRLCDLAQVAALACASASPEITALTRLSVTLCVVLLKGPSWK